MMTSYFVSFGLGTILRGYMQEFIAVNEDVVRAYCNRHFKGLWSSVYDSPPSGCKPLQRPESLHYSEAGHV